jgi:phage gp29-like protein
LFKLELLSTQGGKKNYDTDKVKEYYRAMIFIGMNADILLMGNTQTGSFALGSIKTSMTGAYVEGMLKKIVQVFNDDLIRQLYELNGWDVSRRARMDYEGFSEIDLEAFSKAVQRMGAVAMLPRTPDVVNMVLKQLGVDVLPGDTTQDEILALFPDSADVQSRAGDGMSEGMPSGTGSAVGSAGDSSSMNADNSA